MEYNGVGSDAHALPTSKELALDCNDRSSLENKNSCGTRHGCETRTGFVVT